MASAHEWLVDTVLDSTGVDCAEWANQQCLVITSLLLLAFSVIAFLFILQIEFGKCYLVSCYLLKRKKRGFEVLLGLKQYKGKEVEFSVWDGFVDRWEERKTDCCSDKEWNVCQNQNITLFFSWLQK